MKYVFSKHALAQMKIRGISKEIVDEILLNPHEVRKEDDKLVCQSIVQFKDEGNYLIRIFINTTKQPNTIITVYKTSKVSKYYEGEIRQGS